MTLTTRLFWLFTALAALVVLALGVLAGTALAQPTPAEPPPPPPPRIEAPGAQCQPGRAVSLRGRNLGRLPGRLRVSGLPDGVRPKVLEWSNGALMFRLPADLSGIGDGTFNLRVLRSDGRLSNRVTCRFRAARTTTRVKLSRYTTADCGTAPTDTNIASGQLAGCRHEAVGSSGVDRWKSRPLGEGWRITGWIFQDLSEGGGTARPETPPADGDTAVDLSLQWTVGASGSAAYHFLVKIEGPRGTPADAIAQP